MPFKRRCWRSLIRTSQQLQCHPHDAHPMVMELDQPCPRRPRQLLPTRSTRANWRFQSHAGFATRVIRCPAALLDLRPQAFGCAPHTLCPKPRARPQGQRRIYRAAVPRTPPRTSSLRRRSRLVEQSRCRPARACPDAVVKNASVADIRGPVAHRGPDRAAMIEYCHLWQARHIL
jgi:hypothetical protein